MLFGVAQARYFVGVPVTVSFSSAYPLGHIGAQFGTYDLGSGFGLRAAAEVNPSNQALYGGADLLYTGGESNRYYLGVGGLYGATGTKNELYVQGVAGMDFDVESLVSFFTELQPRYNLESEAGSIFVRFGVNVHLGD